jgi:cold shock protein
VGAVPNLGPVSGTVKWWKSAKGYGVVLTPDTEPKGIWVSFSHIDGDGPRELFEGEIVEIEYKPAQQDSFRFSAVRVRRG